MEGVGRATSLYTQLSLPQQVDRLGSGSLLPRCPIRVPRSTAEVWVPPLPPGGPEPPPTPSGPPPPPPRRPRAKEKHSGSRRLNIRPCLQNKKEPPAARERQRRPNMLSSPWAFVCQEVKRPLCFFIYREEAVHRRLRGSGGGW